VRVRVRVHVRVRVKGPGGWTRRGHRTRAPNECIRPTASGLRVKVKG
jgi:hypothetical protein